MVTSILKVGGSKFLTDLDAQGLKKFRKFVGTILPTQIYENPRIYPCYALFSFNTTRRDNPPRHVCLFLFDVTRRGNPPHHICLFLFNRTRRGNPPCHVCLFYL